MPSSSFGESLVGIQEVKDGVDRTKGTVIALEGSKVEYGPALRTRARNISRFPPLGPPDMLYTRKRYAPVVGSSKFYGYYHFVRGVEVSSVASITAYIVDVVRNNGLDPAAWTSAGYYDVISASYAAYNILSRVDLLVHVDFPGSTTAKAIDGSGNVVDMDDMFWNEVVVSSFVRDILEQGEVPHYPCLRVLAPTLRTEAVFLDAAEACVHRWHLSGTPGSGAATEFPAKSMVAYAIKEYFLSVCRYEACIEFFLRERLQEVDIQCLVYAAAAARMKGDIDAAHKILDDVMEEMPESDVAWMERARLFRAEGNLAKALEAANEACAHTADEVHAWVLLSDLYVDNRQYGKAFEALNSADLAPAALDPFLREIAKSRKDVTIPVEGAAEGTDTIRVLRKKLREETSLQDKTDTVLSSLPARQMDKTEDICYNILVKILNDLSWDDMLAVRGECFVMETDVDASTSIDGADESANQQNENSAADQTANPEANNETSENANTANAEDVDSSNGISTISLEEDGLEDNPDAGDSANTAEIRRQTFEKTGKKVCKPWLDFLVQNMYEDLRAWALWGGEEQNHASASNLASAVLSRKKFESENGNDNGSVDSAPDVEAASASVPAWRSCEDVLKTNKRPMTDWLHRGELARRLARREEAKTAYEVCVKLSQEKKGTAVTALKCLLAAAVEDSESRAVVKHADAIWTYMDSSTDRKSSSEPTPPVPDVRKAIFNLISKKGLRSVREVVTRVDVDRKRMESLILDAVAFRVEGFSR